VTPTIELETFQIAKGKHQSPDAGMCVMEAVAFVANEKFSDHPVCASKVIGEFLRSWNDGMNDEDRQMLRPLIPRLIGTKGTPAQEKRRSWVALDWYCRVSAPAWLRLAGLGDCAKAIERTAPIVDSKSAKAAQDALNRARTEAAAARAAARDAAGDAAGDAAWDAAGDAAWDAARAAAGDAARAAARAAARDAAWDAARAAAGDAARAAARDALRPTVEVLQKSAYELVEAMIAVTEDA